MFPADSYFRLIPRNGYVAKRVCVFGGWVGMRSCASWGGLVGKKPLDWDACPPGPPNLMGWMWEFQGSPLCVVCACRTAPVAFPTCRRCHTPITATPTLDIAKVLDTPLAVLILNEFLITVDAKSSLDFWKAGRKFMLTFRGKPASQLKKAKQVYETHIAAKEVLYLNSSTVYATSTKTWWFQWRATSPR